MTIEAKTEFTQFEKTAAGFGQMLEKATQDNVIDSQEASEILEAYYKNRNEIINYSKEQLANLQKALGISNKNKLFANAEFKALKAKKFEREIHPTVEEREANIVRETLVTPDSPVEPEKKAEEDKILRTNLESQEGKKYARLWSADGTITLKLVSNPNKTLTFNSNENAVVEFTGETVLGKRKGVIVNGELYGVYPTSYIETGENITNVSPDLFPVVADRFLGRSYDSYKGMDGGAKSTNDGKWVVSFGEGASKKVDQKPLACSDLVREVLLASGLKFDFFENAKKDSYDFRRVSVMEEELFTEPGFNMVKIDENSSGYKVGDMITTTKKGSGTRHIGVVKEIGPDGKPARMVHSSFSAKGVVDTTFAEFIKNGSYELTNRVRFLPETYKVAMKRQGREVAMNYVS